MTAVSLARIVADELAMLRPFPADNSGRGRPRWTVWSNQLPGFGIRYYGTGRSIYVVQCLMQGVTRTVTLGNTKVLSKQDALAVVRRVLLRAQVGEDPANARQTKRKAPSFADFLKLYWTRIAPKWKPSTQRTQFHYRRKYLDNAFAGNFIDEVEQADVLP